MERIELMKVAESFVIQSVGLVVMPSFDLSPDEKWQNITEWVTIEAPNGHCIEAEALFSVVHFNITNPEIPVTQRWRVMVSFQDLEKQHIPIGSKIMASPQIVAILIGSSDNSVEIA